MPEQALDRIVVSPNLGRRQNAVDVVVTRLAEANRDSIILAFRSSLLASPRNQVMLRDPVHLAPAKFADHGRRLLLEWGGAGHRAMV